MHLERIWAVVLRYLYVVRNFSRLAEFIFWPMIDIGFYGLIASWISAFASSPQVIPMFVNALVLWQIVYRANYEICVNVIDEFWEQNLFNLMATPLTHMDWIFAMMFSGLIKVSFTLLFGSLIAWVFFGVHIWTLGWLLLAFVILGVLSGWIMGLIAAGILIYYGPKLQTLPWITTTLVALFSAIYYPLSILPNWMQLISRSLPTTHIFEGLRFFLQTGSMPYLELLLGFTLAFLYLGLATQFFIHMFTKVKQKGFPRLV